MVQLWWTIVAARFTFTNQKILNTLTLIGYQCPLTGTDCWLWKHTFRPCCCGSLILTGLWIHTPVPRTCTTHCDELLIRNLNKHLKTHCYDELANLLLKTFNFLDETEIALDETTVDETDPVSSKKFEETDM
ncbi:hypothetical protein HanIR_Chr13g0654741 [Helianthus annuus]|nr:hypothetical protein HanIR_Chr13g0654741 [Helianthus annuus]